MKIFKRKVILALMAMVMALSLFLLHSVSKDVKLAVAQYSRAKTALSPSIISAVKKFVFFIGYARSGHSIIGSLMDAHPHVVIANELFLFEVLPLLNGTSNTALKEDLFQKLYSKSVEDSSGVRAESWKGYTLTVEGLWQGRFDGDIQVIGDKSGGHMTSEYLRSKEEFMSNYLKLKTSLSIPIQIIHVIRNPFDIASTRLAVCDRKNFKTLKENFLAFKKKAVTKIKNPSYLNTVIETLFNEFNAVSNMINFVFDNESIVEVHSCDFVSDPKGVLIRIFSALEVDVSVQYLNVCAEKVFKSVSHTRNMVEWSPEQIEMVEQKMRSYNFLNRYSFTTD